MLTGEPVSANRPASVAAVAAGERPSPIARRRRGGKRSNSTQSRKGGSDVGGAAAKGLGPAAGSSSSTQSTYASCAGASARSSASSVATWPQSDGPKPCPRLTTSASRIGREASPIACARPPRNSATGALTVCCGASRSSAHARHADERRGSKSGTGAGRGCAGEPCFAPPLASPWCSGLRPGMAWGAGSSCFRGTSMPAECGRAGLAGG
mmetsp:Transcript_4586/g.15033  ORF Transcript_4586/g.15033 Transcript_4586/m.15033 type:complete len:210 (-) Transcript_4586:364-993(-)|eukprot:scaffold2778_cov88-Isochrysis_galbana.AAC.2